GDADIAFAGICAIGLLAREIAPGDDAHASFLPQAFGHAFAVAEFGNIEPEKKSAGRAHVTVSVADDLVGQIELRRIELAVFHHVRLIAVSRNGDVLERDWN